MDKSLNWNIETDTCQIGTADITRVVDLDRQAFAPRIIFPEATDEIFQKHSANLHDQNFDRNTLDLFLSFHAYLLRIKNKTILVDMCVGNDKSRIERPVWHKRKGPFIKNLNNIGIKTTDIDYVMCTHLHADHVGWNTQLLDGRWVPTFPNAEYIFSKKEYNHWENGDGRYSEKEKLLHGSFYDSVMPVIKSGQEHALLCGDTLHHPIQLDYPGWKTNFCSDPEQAIITRINLLEEYADTKTLILPAHFHSKDLGLISKVDGQYILRVKD